MTIKLEELSKKFNKNWIFRDLDYTFESGKCYAIVGHNGSGKSTLLKIIAGMQSANAGMLTWAQAGKVIPKEKWYQHLTFCAPAMDIIDEMFLEEFLHFHFKFKKPLPNITVDAIISMLEMEPQRMQKIAEFSSGMKQRVKLAQAFFSESSVLFLDEPTSNLDEKWIGKYQEWLRLYIQDRICIIASNEKREYLSADFEIQLPIALPVKS